jgi:hypothetical protein
LGANYFGSDNTLTQDKLRKFSANEMRRLFDVQNLNKEKASTQAGFVLLYVLLPKRRDQFKDPHAK